MLRFPLLLALAGAAILVLAAAAAVPSASDSNAGAAILMPLSLLKTKDMDFGGLLASRTAGTVVLDPYTGAVTTTGGGTAVNGATSAASFTGTGTGKAAVQIRLPKNPITVTRSGGTETMTVGTWTVDGKTTRQITPSKRFNSMSAQP